jgi:hypothetical protein
MDRIAVGVIPGRLGQPSQQRTDRRQVPQVFSKLLTPVKLLSDRASSIPRKYYAVRELTAEDYVTSKIEGERHEWHEWQAPN